MAGARGFASSRSYGGDGYSNHPGMRRNRNMFPRQQQCVVRQRRTRNRDESDDSNTTLSQPPTNNYLIPPWLPPSNLDFILESVTPFVTARYFSEVMVGELRIREALTHPSYCLKDLWESFSEWSAYGVGVPLVLNGKYPVKQFYVPLLSGIQLYVDPSEPHSRLRMPGEDNDAESSRNTHTGGSSDAESSRKTHTGGSSDCEVDKQSEASVPSSSSAEAERRNSPGQLLFEYLEQEQPHNRKPLTDKMSVLASEFPELRMLKSYDLLPASWISVAWYPIYRIPVGPTLKDLDASFLTFHFLSTHSKCSAQQLFHVPAGHEVYGRADGTLRMPLPIFGLASYKLQGSILTPSGPHECMQENSLLQAADKWLQHLHVVLPDYEFFRAHYSRWR